MNLKKIIENESKRWVAGGIIEQEQAQKILGLYPEKKINGFNWGTLIFSSIGGIIFGLGVILFFSYNWDKLHRLFKLALILSALLSAEIIAFYIKFKKEKTALSEGIFALGTMFFGGGIWLVAQVYNIDEHYPNGFFIWGLGALLMGWALHSSVQGIIASSIFSLWCGIEAFEFSYSPHIVFPLILLGIVPLALRKESILLFAIAIFSFLICLLFVGIKLFEIYLYLVFISVGAMFIALSVLLKASIFSRDKSKISFIYPVLMIFGNICYWSVLFCLTFKSICRDLSREIDIFQNYYATLYVSIFFILSIISWILIFIPFSRFKYLMKDFLPIGYLAIPVSLILTLFPLLYYYSPNYSKNDDFLLLTAIFFNIIYVFQALSLISYGSRHLSILHIFWGTMLFAILVFARYIDLFTSLLIRSIVFLLVGTGIFYIGLMYSKSKKQIGS